MRNRFERINSIFHFIGDLVGALGILLLLPLVCVLLYWDQFGEGLVTVYAFALPAMLCFLLCLLLNRLFKPIPLDSTGSMLICALSWIIISALGALPFVIGIKASYLNSYFEAMSGFTTTGITVFTGLDQMPRSILFWRSVTQWLGGTGILSFYLVVMFEGGGSHHILGAESHKITSGRPAPGLINTLKIVWGLYAGFTFLAAVCYALEGMPYFDAICHALTTLSTGGFSPHDTSIEFYRLNGFAHFRLIEYTVAFFMMLGGINFLIHFRVCLGDFKALWDNAETRYWWYFLSGFTLLIMFDHLYRHGHLFALFVNPAQLSFAVIERAFRLSIFQVLGCLTTTGFGTQDIGSSFFPALSKQLFLVMMVIGGCVGSTGGGFKVQRIVILLRLMFRELFRLRVPSTASASLIIDGRVIEDDDIHRVSALFFTWIALITFGGLVTALLSSHGPLASISGMFSAVGNIGPCYISVAEMVVIHPLIKLTYILGMLAGRLEILPVLLLFSRKAWS